MKNTETAEFKQMVFTYLCDSVDLDGYNLSENLSEAELAQHIADRFNEEFNYEYNKQRWPNTQTRVGEWLMGLPLMIACYYNEIIALNEKWHGHDFSDHEAEMIIYRWFKFLSMKLDQLWRKHGIIVK